MRIVYLVTFLFIFKKPFPLMCVGEWCVEFKHSIIMSALDIAKNLYSINCTDIVNMCKQFLLLHILWILQWR